MLLWTVFAALTAFAALLIVRPYWRQGERAAAQSHDVAVYKQQLEEIEEETARGLLGEAEAQAARIEVSRRILAASDDFHAAGPPRGSASAPYVIIGLLATISMAAYLVFGSPNLPDQPLHARAAPEDSQPSIESLVARVEARLATNPEDGAGWAVIAPVYLRLGRYDDAAKALKNAIRLVGETPDRLGDLGEALTLAGGNKVSGEAAAAFQKVLSLEPQNERAQFWLGMADEQGGKLSEAAGRYRKLLAQTLPDNVRNIVQQRLTDVDARLAGAPSAPEQAAMIDKMVAGLAERLKADGSDLEGWLKLMRAYTVLGRRDEALDALKRAQGQFAGNQEALAQIDQMAKTLGLTS
ncbi:MULTISPECIES: c-type cytochrome biogenesis protein CcmI [Rhodomicrobium]|uniref:c-type cytochrome biogenesis protein CcmI n=1 Tax=Rhodomicrobium TaxID=1068 RepID=UPI0014828780|nr:MULTISPECIES: c-type cytochrome biogenesis protein CcmI [Rhodomicrobium]